MMQERAIVLHECPEDGDIAGYDGPGWYFRDEGYMLHGPFFSKEECEELAKDYLEKML